MTTGKGSFPSLSFLCYLNCHLSEGQGREGIQEKTVMTIKKNSELNNTSDNFVISEIQETKDVAYNLAEQRKMRVNTEETQHCLEQEGDRRSEKEESQQ